MLPKWIPTSQNIHTEIFQSYHTKITEIPWVKTDKIDKLLDENMEGLKADHKTLTNKLTHFKNATQALHAASAWLILT